jgi:hypothetical protein
VTHAEKMADDECQAWYRFVGRLDLEDATAMRLAFVWYRLRRAFLKD